MKRITFLHWIICPYCMQAKKAMKELMAENSSYSEVSVEWIDTMIHPTKPGEFEHYYVPAMFVEGEKYMKDTPVKTMKVAKRI